MNKAKRHAAGYICLGAFHAMHVVNSMLDNVLREMHEGLSERELQFIFKRKNRYHDEAETLRKLGWRFINS